MKTKFLVLIGLLNTLCFSVKAADFDCTLASTAPFSKPLNLRSDGSGKAWKAEDADYLAVADWFETEKKLTVHVLEKKGTRTATAMIWNPSANTRIQVFLNENQGASAVSFLSGVGCTQK